MKKTSKNEIDMLDLINKIQTQLTTLDKKVDTLINRSLQQATASPKTPVATNRREMYKAICADCKKECSIPFKPSGERPVYCQDCFSRRKVINLSGIKVDPKPQIIVPKPEVKKKKKPAPKKK
jgi:CxxC-x17-CxxC domain-containing protein